MELDGLSVLLLHVGLQAVARLCLAAHLVLQERQQKLVEDVEFVVCVFNRVPFFIIFWLLLEDGDDLLGEEARLYPPIIPQLNNRIFNEMLVAAEEFNISGTVHAKIHQIVHLRMALGILSLALHVI